MRRSSQRWNRSPVVNAMDNARRRWRWFLAGASYGQVSNLVVSAVSFALHRSTSGPVPVLIKLDISPVCNLHCSFCVHAAATDEALQEQRFSSTHRIDLDQFRSLVNQVRGRSSMLALYYVGDPLVHPDLARMCRIAADAGIRTHVSTNFSFVLSDERIRALLTSGLSHLTVCLDSMVQSEYAKTRVGGDVERVLSNLERLLAMRAEDPAGAPHVEVQYIKFQHNIDHVGDAERWCRRHGVDQFTTYWGNLHNYVDLQPDDITVIAPHRRGRIPHCAWPYFAMTVRFDGAALPCCYHRVSEQYRTGGDDRPIANVFREPLGSVWRGPLYAQLRRLVWDPAGAPDDTRTSSFCHGCDAIAHTTTDDRRRKADEHVWEPVTFGRPPRPEAATAVTAVTAVTAKPA